ncbi:MAG: DUF5610 domain-containing protein [Gammaproteobacteria bacterium]|nr:DUF5610 domain-containing protein [Gammaproteobacteria bacterium]
MSIAATTNNTSTDAVNVAANNTKTAATETQSKKELTAYQASLQNRQALNSQILSSSLNISLKSDNQSMSLLFKTALEKVQAEFSSSSEKITAEATAKTESKAYETEVDNSPKATSERIVGMAAGFYQKFKERNPNDTEALTKFMDKFSQGIEKGFADAKDILKSLDKLNGKVATDIDETYGLVQKGLKTFQEKVAEEEKTAKNSPTSSTTNAKTSNAA